MRTETEMRTRESLRRRREERRQEKIHNRLTAITLAVTTVAGAACLVYLEWSALVVAFAGK